MSKGKHKDYSQEHRKRYNVLFQKRYGMAHTEWAKWKKNHTKEEVQERRERARIIKEKSS